MKIIVTATPSLNGIKNGWNRWRIKNKYVKQLEGYQYQIGVCVNKRHVTLQRYGSRVLDLDNYYGGVKPLLDAMKKVGLIKDDREEWLTLEYLPQVKCKRGEEKIIIEVTNEAY